MGDSVVRFQNNIQSLFSRIRLLYGATPIEDIINYNQIVRMLTEHTATTQVGSLDQTSISDGIGGVVFGTEGLDTTSPTPPHNPVDPPYTPRLPLRTGFVNIRQAYIQGIDGSDNAESSAALTGSPATSIEYANIMPMIARGQGYGYVPNKCTPAGALDNNGTCTIRRYQVSFALGLFNQEKLIPTKFMASQLAIEITLATPAECIYMIPSVTGSPTKDPSYSVTNINLIPEILEFDASYDAMFLKGLQTDGVPLKFSSWHTYIFGTGGSSNLNLQIQERSRSVKALFAVQRRAPYSVETDSGAMFLASTQAVATNNLSLNSAQTLQSYQFRIGGRYFPASPVQVSLNTGSSSSNGGAEAFVELQKALNVVGDYRLSTGVNVLKWGQMPAYQATQITTNSIATFNAELDYATNLIDHSNSGAPGYGIVTFPRDRAGGGGSSFSGNGGSQAFVMAIDLETSNGVEISGLNAEEQSDISLIATYSGPQNANYNLEVYAYYDAMIILRENNVRKRFMLGYRIDSIMLLIKSKLCAGNSMDLEYTEIYIDSSDGITVNPTYASTDWASFRFVTPLQRIAKMKVIEAEIPFSYYVINNENNQFTLAEPATATVTIPVGNYSSTTLPTVLGSAMTAVSPGARTYTVTYNTTSQKLLITASAGTFSISVNSQLQLILGMAPINASSGTTLVAPNVAQITGPNYLYLNSDTLGPSFQTYLPSTAPNFSPSKGPQLARIPVNTNPGDIIYYNDPAPEKWFDTQNLLQLNTLELYFTLGNTTQKVRFNGQPFSIKLGLLLYPDVNNRVKQNASNSGVKMILG